MSMTMSPDRGGLSATGTDFTIAVTPSLDTESARADAASFTCCEAVAATFTCIPTKRLNNADARLCGSKIHFPTIATAYRRFARFRHSGSAAYVTMSNSCPANGSRWSRIVLSCASVNSLHANCFWRPTRAIFSSSANLFNRAASFSFLDARSFAFPDSVSALSARSCALVALSNAVVARSFASRASLYREAMVSVNSSFVRTSAPSPTARPTIRAMAACFSTHFLNSLLSSPLRMCSKSDKTSKRAPVMTVASATYSTPSQNAEERQRGAIQSMLRRSHRESIGPMVTIFSLFILAIAKLLRETWNVKYIIAGLSPLLQQQLIEARAGFDQSLRHVFGSGAAANFARLHSFRGSEHRGHLRREFGRESG